MSSPINYADKIAILKEANEKDRQQYNANVANGIKRHNNSIARRMAYRDKEIARLTRKLEGSNA